MSPLSTRGPHLSESVRCDNLVQKCKHRPHEPAFNANKLPGANYAGSDRGRGPPYSGSYAPEVSPEGGWHYGLWMVNFLGCRVSLSAFGSWARTCRPRLHSAGCPYLRGQAGRLRAVSLGVGFQLPSPQHRLSSLRPFAGLEWKSHAGLCGSCPVSTHFSRKL